MEPILEVNNISKKFRINHERHSYLNLRDSLVSVLKAKSVTTEEFSALRNVSFNVVIGESIGIIGKNGAGKSTLLKILSRITLPTSGSIKIRGRIASLLEVGTGFHPELTGRENIFLNGSLLGMRRREILSKFDEIVDFSGTERFLDTPLKHFSSGMQLRLAFSVAAFLEPEILVIDEVLAVGDVEFQKKCMGKMEQVGKEGRTILFVSHNMEAVSRLCSKAILLQNGAITYSGDTHKTISEYYAINENLAKNVELSDRRDRSGSGKCRFQKVWCTDKNGTETVRFRSGDFVKIHSLIKSYEEKSKKLYASVSLCNNGGERLFSLGSGLINKMVVVNGLTEIQWIIPKLPLSANDYWGDLFLYETNGGLDMNDQVEHAFRFLVDEGDFHGTGMLQEAGRDMVFVNFDVEYKNVQLDNKV